MTRADRVLLEALRCGIFAQPFPKDTTLAPEEWEFLLHRADEQELLPLVFDTVCRCPSLQALEQEQIARKKERALSVAMREIVQTNEFLNLALAMQADGLDPVVLKGITVRSLYPLPMLRPSVDEDLLVLPDEAEQYHRFFREAGLCADDPGAEPATAAELSYHKENSPTYIELHMSLFSPESAAYGELNGLFEGVLERTARVQVEDVSLRTLAPTDHLLYLLCHAYKHFLHGGFGIRQVCDIGLFARQYDLEIDWGRIRKNCEQVSIARFCAALFRIAEKQLGFAMPAAFAGLAVDEHDLLEDVLTGGLYGVNDINRAHSSTMTLDAVAARRRGKKRGGALASVFLPLGSMKGKYPYLMRFPALLPLAWAQRVLRYLLHRDGLAPSDPAETVRIGRERIALLKEYGILD